MPNPVVRGFQNVARFSGRDTRGQFWPYAGVVIVLIFIVNFVVGGFTMASVFADMQAFAEAHPDAATVSSGPGHYSIQIDPQHPAAPMPDFAPFIIGLGAVVTLAVLLLAAAVSRRLHDTGRSALWGLLPVPFLAFCLIAFPLAMSQTATAGEPDAGLFGLIFVNNIVYLAALVTLVVLLCQRSRPGANRHGPSSAQQPEPDQAPLI